MDSFGLPTSFGKPGPGPTVTPSNAESSSSSRGNSSGRGPRGAVGSGKRARGRGRGGVSSPTQETKHFDEASTLNSGVKRPDPPSPDQLDNTASLPQNSAPVVEHPPNDISRAYDLARSQRGGRGDGVFRGNRGGRGGRGGFRGGMRAQDIGQGESGDNTHRSGRGNGTIEKGFFKESFCEDPWADLMAKRERRLQAQSGASK